jgi:hypothetical protein
MEHAADGGEEAALGFGSPIVWAVASLAVWALYVALRGRWTALGIWERRHVAFGVLTTLLFANFLALSPDFQARNLWAQAPATATGRFKCAHARIHMHLLPRICSTGLGRCLLLLWQPAAVLHLQLPVERAWLGQGLHPVELCADHSLGLAESGAAAGLEGAAARCVCGDGDDRATQGQACTCSRGISSCC